MRIKKATVTFKKNPYPCISWTLLQPLNGEVVNGKFVDNVRPGKCSCTKK